MLTSFIAKVNEVQPPIRSPKPKLTPGKELNKSKKLNINHLQFHTKQILTKFKMEIYLAQAVLDECTHNNSNQITNPVRFSSKKMNMFQHQYLTSFTNWEVN